MVCNWNITCIQLSEEDGLNTIKNQIMVFAYTGTIQIQDVQRSISGRNPQITEARQNKVKVEMRRILLNMTKMMDRPKQAQF